MIAWNHVAIAYAVLTTLQWLHALREGLSYVARSRDFEREASEPLPSPSPFVSVLVPARNEEGGISKCLESLVAQDYPNFEIVAIDDRSTDRTGVIMDEWAARSNGRLKVVHVESLPEDWLGKNHALHLGTRTMRAETEFILFTDGDVVFEPGTLRVSIRHCQARAVDHLVLGPRMLASGPWLAAVQLVFGMAFLTILRPSRLGRSKDVYVGIGAFNLVRRRFYEASGGHERLRLEVVDDGMLGKILVGAGAKADMIDGKKWIRLAWYDSVSGFVKGLEKNGFAALRYSLVRTALLVLANLWIYVLPYVFLATTDGSARWLLAALVLYVHLNFAIAAVLLASSPFLSLIVPFAGMIVLYTFLRSAAVTLWRGGIEWRDTHHSLDVLKRNMV